MFEQGEGRVEVVGAFRRNDTAGRGGSGVVADLVRRICRKSYDGAVGNVRGVDVRVGARTCDVVDVVRHVGIGDVVARAGNGRLGVGTSNWGVGALARR